MNRTDLVTSIGPTTGHPDSTTVVCTNTTTATRDMGPNTCGNLTAESWANPMMMPLTIATLLMAAHRPLSTA
uniref:hypothetical protein n=1 Tax=Mycobacterium sp. HUMS_1102779 TaxID=3383487 RepID=UPI00389A9ADE